MNHFMMDAFKGYRSRLDDILLVHELLEELPQKLGLKAVMPPFVLPYYNGVIPEDCGISGFVFLAGGHFTIHTFSYRESFFVDVCSPEPLDTQLLEQTIKEAFPAELVQSFESKRGGRQGLLIDPKIDEKLDFGPHLMLDFQDYRQPVSLDDLFTLFDEMPYRIGMTPIVRPYAVKGQYHGKKVISILTMIAESHISLHCFPEEGLAYFDLFSCRFFDYQDVAAKLKREFQGEVVNEILTSRGSKYLHLRNTNDAQMNKSQAWLENVRRAKS